jgi:Ca2+-binding EF-hand superfamily protein
MQLRSQFEAMDLNKSGTITQQDLASCLQANFSIDTSEAEALFRGLDAHGTDEIRYSEFLAAAMEDRMRMHQDVLTATFDRIDVDGTGQITASNLRALLGDNFEGSDVEELIREADQTGDGRISRPEFLKYISSHEEEPEEEAEPPKDDSPKRVMSPARRRLSQHIHGHLDAAITAKEAVEKTPPVMSPRLGRMFNGNGLTPNSFLPDAHGNAILPKDSGSSSGRKRWRVFRCFERPSDIGATDDSLINRYPQAIDAC